MAASCCSRSGPITRWTSSGEIAWLVPVPTHDCTVAPSPFFSNSLTTPCRPPCFSMMPLITETIPAPTIPPNTPSNMPIVFSCRTIVPPRGVPRGHTRGQAPGLSPGLSPLLAGPEVVARSLSAMALVGRPGADADRDRVARVVVARRDVANSQFSRRRRRRLRDAQVVARV